MVNIGKLSTPCFKDAMPHHDRPVFRNQRGLGSIMADTPCGTNPSGVEKLWNTWGDHGWISDFEVVAIQAARDHWALKSTSHGRISGVIYVED